MVCKTSAQTRWVILVAAAAAAVLLLFAAVDDFGGAEEASVAADLDETALIVEEAWTRAGFAGGNTAVYMKLTNAGSEALRLVGAASSAAEAVELHETVITEDHVMLMEPVEAVELPPGGTVELRPAGLHVMLLGLKRDLAEGDRLELELTIEGLDPVQVSAPARIGPVDGHGHDHQHEHGHDHDHHEGD